MRFPDLPPPAELRRARDRFADLLARKTAESDWQQLFTDCPYILSTALPLSLSPAEIVPLGRPGRTEADFLIQASSSGPSAGLYGVIEIKKPSHEIAVHDEPLPDDVITSTDARRPPKRSSTAEARKA